MKRQLLVVALSGAIAGPVLAEDTVTVYGVADVTFESVSAKGATAPGVNLESRNRVSSNSSNIGFRGSEDLTPDLKAIFQIESDLRIDSGAGGTLATRDSFVGLTGSFGTLKLGTNSSPVRVMGGQVDFTPGGTSIANNISLFSYVNGASLGYNLRLTNSVMYVSPNLGGFVGSLIYGANEGKANAAGATPAKDDPSYGLGLFYTTAPVWVGYGYEERKDKASLANFNSKDTVHRAAANYVFGATKVGFGFDREESAGTYGAGAGSIKRDVWGLLLSQNFGTQHQLLFQYTQAQHLKCSGTANTTASCATNGDDTGAKLYTLAHHFFLSKRTMIRTYYARIVNEAQGKYDFDVNAVSASFATRAAGADPTGFGVGIRHTF